MGQPGRAVLRYGPVPGGLHALRHAWGIPPGGPRKVRAAGIQPAKLGQVAVDIPETVGAPEGHVLDVLADQRRGRVDEWISPLGWLVLLAVHLLTR